MWCVGKIGGEDRTSRGFARDGVGGTSACDDARMRESSSAALPGRAACPACGHTLFTVALPAAPAALVGDAGAHPQRGPGPVLLRIAEAARLIGVSRTAMYQLVAANEVPGGSDRALDPRRTRWS